MTNQSFAKFTALAATTVALPALSWADTTDSKDVKSPKDGKTPIEQTQESCITGDIGINQVSQYVTRGVILENQGSISQPYADLYIRVYKGADTDILNKVQLNIGTWDSFQHRRTDEGSAEGHPGISSTPNWYESDFTGGITATLFKNLSVTPSYFCFTSPNDAFKTFQGLNLKVAYDDTDLLKAFALHPYFQILWELDNKAGTGPSQGVYYELGIAPGAAIPGVKDLSFTVPVTAGFGTHNFYGAVGSDGGTYQDNFGYLSVGFDLSYSLSFVPKCFGTWTANAAVTYYYLGNVLADFNTVDTGGDIRGEHHSEWVWSGGVALAF
jgi:hypothetical protein